MWLAFICLAETFPEDQSIVNVQKGATICHSDHISLEDHASDILRCHYGTLSQSLRYPIRVAQLLHEEEVILQTRLTIVKFTAESFTGEEAIFLLLKAICCAVHSNYYNLKMFISILLQFSENVPCTNAILKDYGKYMSYNVLVIVILW